MHVAAKITISQGVSLQEEHILSYQLFLRSGVWEKQGGIDELDDYIHDTYIYAYTQ
jgi:hypothetical protein